MRCIRNLNRECCEALFVFPLILNGVNNFPLLSVKDILGPSDGCVTVEDRGHS